MILKQIFNSCRFRGATIFEETVQSSLSKQWQVVMEKELNSLNENDTWGVINVCNLIGSKWVFKIKWDSKGKV